MIEVQPLQNTYCSLKRTLSKMDGSLQAKDVGFTNQSTWILLLNQPELAARLVPCSGLTSVPIVLKLSAFGQD